MKKHLALLILPIVCFLGCGESLFEPPIIKDRAWNDPDFYSPGLIYLMNDSTLIEINPNTYEERVVLVHGLNEAVHFNVNNGRTKMVCAPYNDSLFEFSLKTGKKLRAIEARAQHTPSPREFAPRSFGYLSNDTTIWYLNEYTYNNFRIDQIGPKEFIPSIAVPADKRSRMNITAIDVSNNNDVAFCWTYSSGFSDRYSGKAVFSQNSARNVDEYYGANNGQYIAWSENGERSVSWHLNGVSRSSLVFSYHVDGDYRVEQDNDGKVLEHLTRNSIIGPSGAEILIPRKTEDGANMIYIYKRIEAEGTEDFHELGAVKVMKKGINIENDYFDWQ